MIEHVFYVAFFLMILFCIERSIQTKREINSLIQTSNNKNEKTNKEMIYLEEKDIQIEEHLISELKQLITLLSKNKINI